MLNCHILLLLLIIHNLFYIYLGSFVQNDTNQDKELGLAAMTFG